MATEKTVATNRKAYYNYTIDRKVEAGIVLCGTEIKSIRAGKVSLAGAFARHEKGELWLSNTHIAPYECGNRYNHEPTRLRKLLMHRDEINDLTGRMAEKGYALVPLRVYLKDGLAKVELGLAKGKKIYDKRESIARRQAEREIDRTLKTRRTKQ
jgi:SsrA-binding protein